MFILIICCFKNYMRMRLDIKKKNFTNIYVQVHLLLFYCAKENEIYYCVILNSIMAGFFFVYYYYLFFFYFYFISDQTDKIIDLLLLLCLTYTQRIVSERPVDIFSNQNKNKKGFCCCYKRHALIIQFNNFFFCLEINCILYISTL